MHLFRGNEKFHVIWNLVTSLKHGECFIIKHYTEYCEQQNARNYFSVVFTCAEQKQTKNCDSIFNKWKWNNSKNPFHTNRFFNRCCALESCKTQLMALNWPLIEHRIAYIKTNFNTNFIEITVGIIFRLLLWLYIEIGIESAHRTEL